MLLVCAAVTQTWAQLQEGEDDAFKLARNLYRDARDYATAAELFAEFIRNYPESSYLPDARLMLARAYSHSGRCAEAVPAFETFYQQHPEHLETASARRERAACLASLGQHLEAARAYEDVCRRFSASDFAPRALIKAARNYTEAGKPEQAAAAYQRIIEEYGAAPAAHTARYRLALLRFADGHSEAALELLEQIAAAEPPAAEAPSALLLAGRIELFLGDPDGAAAQFARLQQRFPESAQADTAHMEQADYLFQRQQYRQAGEAYRKAYEQADSLGLQQRALLGLADAARHSRQTEAALQHYQELLERVPAEDPLLCEARLGLAIAHGQAGHFTAAVGMLQDLIRAAPDSPAAQTALRELGTLYRNRGDHLLAVSWYRRYLEEAGPTADRDQVRFTLAGIFAATGDYEAAIEAYRALAQEGGPWAAEAQHGLARACEAGGVLRTALREYLVLLEQFPASRHAGAARQRVEYLREFSVMDRDRLDRALQQAWLDELSGAPRQRVQRRVARVLFDHHDYSNAVRVLEHYVAAYQGSPNAAEAQWLLAESLRNLARQRELDARPARADSLRQLALQEYRILSRAAAGGQWTQRAELQLLQLEAGALPDSAALETLIAGLDDFLSRHGGGPLAALALLRQGEAYRRLSVLDSTHAASAIAAYEHLVANHPQSEHVPAALFGQGAAEADLGNAAAAETIFTRILQDHPSSPVAPRVLFELGRLLLAQDRYAEAKARFEELQWAYPAFDQRRAAQEHLADIHFRLGEYGDAVSVYEQLIEGEQETAVAQRLRQRLAAAYRHNGQLEAALECYQAVAAQIAPADAGGSSRLDSLHFAQGLLLEQLGRPEEAIEQFLRVQQGSPGSSLDAKAAGRAAKLLFGRKDYQRAYALVQPYLKETEDPAVFGRAVLALFRQQRVKEARDAAADFRRRFGKESPWNQQFRLAEGQALLQQKQFERARKLFRQVAESEGEWADDGAYYAALALWEWNAADPSPDSAARALEAQSRFVAEYADSPHAADVHMRLGNYHYSMRNYLQAAGAYKHVLGQAVDRQLAGEAIWRLLSCYQGAHEYDEAHRVAERLLANFPDHPRRRDAELEIGIILKEKGQYARAIARLEKVLEWAEGNRASEARYYIGESYQNMGEYRKAIEAYYRVSYHGAEGFSQWITSADYRRAQCHESLGESATAVAVYERIVQREGGDSPQGRLAAERIAALRDTLGPN